MRYRVHGRSLHLTQPLFRSSDLGTGIVHLIHLDSVEVGLQFDRYYHRRHRESRTKQAGALQLW